MHLAACGRKVSIAMGRVWGLYPCVLGLRFPIRALSIIGLVLCAVAIILLLISLKVRVQVWLAVWLILIGLYTKGAEVVGVGLG